MRYHNYDNFLHFDKDLGDIGQELVIFVMIFIEKRKKKSGKSGKSGEKKRKNLIWKGKNKNKNKN